MADDITLDAPETRLERFLAAAAGMDGITLDAPETRIEKYLYKIAQGSGGVPAVEDADKGKYLHANESTGDLEWAEGGGSGGGVLVVHNVNGTLDKTWQEIHDSDFAVLKYSDGIQVTTGALEDDGEYTVGFFTYGTQPTTFVAITASGYPSIPEDANVQ